MKKLTMNDNKQDILNAYNELRKTYVIDMWYERLKEITSHSIDDLVVIYNHYDKLGYFENDLTTVDIETILNDCVLIKTGAS